MSEGPKPPTPLELAREKADELGLRVDQLERLLTSKAAEIIELQKGLAICQEANRNLTEIVLETYGPVTARLVLKGIGIKYERPDDSSARRIPHGGPSPRPVAVAERHEAGDIPGE